MFLFFSFVGEERGRGGGASRGHLKCLRLQPGKGVGEKSANEEGAIINFIMNMLSHQTPPVPTIKKIKCAYKNSNTKLNSQNDWNIYSAHLQIMT